MEAAKILYWKGFHLTLIPKNKTNKIFGTLLFIAFFKILNNICRTHLGTPPFYKKHPF